MVKAAIGGISARTFYPFTNRRQEEIQGIEGRRVRPLLICDRNIAQSEQGFDVDVLK
jgi:hypothetical protein